MNEFDYFKKVYNMSIKETLERDLREAMRNQRESQKRTIRMAIAAIKNAEIDRGQAMDDAGILTILQKEIKIRREEIEGAEKAGRNDLIAASKEEIVVLEAYLPKQLDEAAIRLLAQAAIAEVGAIGPTDMGRVMKALLPRVQGQAAGDVVGRVVKELLQQSQ